MNATELTRLRVAQAARTPVSVDQIREMLRADEAAENAGQERVERLVAEWVDLGVLKALGDDPVLYVQVPVFRDELARRLTAHLLRPRTLLSLEREFARDKMLPNLREHDLGPMVDELVVDGLVVALDDVTDSTELVDAVDSNDEAIDLHPSSRTVLEGRLAYPERSWEFEAGTFFVLSRKGLDALQVT